MTAILKAEIAILILCEVHSDSVSIYRVDYDLNLDETFPLKRENRFAANSE